MNIQKVEGLNYNIPTRRLSEWSEMMLKHFNQQPTEENYQPISSEHSSYEGHLAALRYEVKYLSKKKVMKDVISSIPYGMVASYTDVANEINMLYQSIYNESPEVTAGEVGGFLTSFAQLNLPYHRIIYRDCEFRSLRHKQKVLAESSIDETSGWVNWWKSNNFTGIPRFKLRDVASKKTRSLY